MRVSVIVLLGIFAAPPPTSDAAPTRPTPDVVATVNGVAIHKAMVDSAHAAARGNPKMFTSELPKGAGEAEKAIVDQLIAAELLGQEAQARGIVVPDSEVDGYMKTFKTHFASEKDYTDTLRDHGFTEKDLRDDARRQSAVKRLLEKEVIAKVPIVEEREARAYYDSNPAFFTEPEEVRVAHILAIVDADFSAVKKAKARQKMEKILADAKAGKDFAVLATRESEDEGSRAQGGDVGFVRPNEWPDEFVVAANALKNKGDLSGIVETRFGLHVLKLLERLPPHILPFDDKLKGEIVVRLDHRRQEEATLNYVETLKKKAQIQIWAMPN
ncbi:MAG TPA: peptidylprolyl isomerase [Chthoniobacterales bacterium]|jgi:parvulin-like peptidyl-prolyl isomerase